MSYNGDTEANALFPSLIGSLSFTIPTIDLSGGEYTVPGGAGSQLYEQITRLESEDLTSGVPGSNRIFDRVMASIKAHLREEYDKGRITGADYTRAYIELTSAALSNSVQYLLSRDGAFWQAQTAQIQAITAKVQLQTAKVQAVGVQLEAATTQANYALTKLRLASEDATYAQAKYQVDNLLPAQLALTNAQKAGVDNQNSIASYQLSTVLPAQVLLNQEQMESVRAQTMDTRSNGVTPVSGSMGKQKELYARQIISYQRDSEVKMAKLFTDAWITQKTIDEGLLPPDQFNNTNLNSILTTLRTNNDLD